VPAGSACRHLLSLSAPGTMPGNQPAHSPPPSGDVSISSPARYPSLCLWQPRTAGPRACACGHGRHGCGAGIVFPERPGCRATGTVRDLGRPRRRQAACMPGLRFVVRRWRRRARLRQAAYVPDVRFVVRRWRRRVLFRRAWSGERTCCVASSSCPSTAGARCSISARWCWVEPACMRALLSPGASSAGACSDRPGRRRLRALSIATWRATDCRCVVLSLGPPGRLSGR